MMDIATNEMTCYIARVYDVVPDVGMHVDRILTATPICHSTTCLATYDWLFTCFLFRKDVYNIRIMVRRNLIYFSHIRSSVTRRIGR